MSGNEVLVTTSSLGKDAENEGLSGSEQCGEPVAMIRMARGKKRIVMIPMRQIIEVLNPLIAIPLEFWNSSHRKPTNISNHLAHPW